MSNAVSDPPVSRTWFTPDLGLGCHYFRYTMSQYDGLAHMHGEYCFVACLSGEIDIGFRGREEIVQRGEFTIVNPGQIHQCRFGIGEDSSSGLTVIVRPSMLRALVGSMGFPLIATGREVRFRGKQGNSEASELISKVIDELQSQRQGRETLLELLLRQILVYVVRSWPASLIRLVELPLLPQLPWVQMHRATEFMNSHGKTSFRLTDLCVDVGLSASRFIPLFKNSSGISPHCYYNSLLVFKARRLLHQRASTKEAAYALGFKNVSHFCALFHQLTGATPQADQARPGSGGADLQWHVSGTGRPV